MSVNLSSQALENHLSSLLDWHLQENKLCKIYQFNKFTAAIEFVNQVALLAEQQNHHPDITIHYTQVTLELWSHDTQRISERDIRLAHAIDGV